MATIFTKIINGEIPGTFVYEDDECVAFLDVSPLTDGHTMVVPRAEISQWTDLDEGLLDHLMNVARRIGRAQKEAFDCERIGLMIVGYEVPHVHIHVWPTTSMADFDISDRAPMQDADTLAGPAEKIRQALAQQS
ncbi:HIT family protein [Brevibacterium casei]|uniref:Diadenosine tetraphosphate (Ap4A) hydrolase n=2 Tax=Brevibacterium casei TaxID=33889 RepID=A0A2H1IF44_9MICO|nr:HIT family protein [Brevibacterium casei]QPR40404.1 HIT family protein [Brevibacterium casei]QPR44559.1 HIT family protein [Brevibacterium casei]SMX73740.1 Diadenosine tetraphosphate (Ap4A) hydrolase [Brevibacterium casei CIP 102111]VEW12019.1 purine nucleoside phosphoramidase [Brevibacterium casei]